MVTTSSFKVLEDAFTKGSQEDVAAALKVFAETPLSRADGGAVLTGLALMYTKLKTEINEAYIAQLKATIETVQSLNAQEKEMDTASRLANVRKSL